MQYVLTGVSSLVVGIALYLYAEHRRNRTVATCHIWWELAVDIGAVYGVPRLVVIKQLNETELLSQVALLASDDEDALRSYLSRPPNQLDKHAQIYRLKIAMRGSPGRPVRVESVERIEITCRPDPVEVIAISEDLGLTKYQRGVPVVISASVGPIRTRAVKRLSITVETLETPQIIDVVPFGRDPIRVKLYEPSVSKLSWATHPIRTISRRTGAKTVFPAT